MKKLLVINLHTHNFGDEALGRSIINKLIDKNIYPSINILYSHNNEISNKGFINFDNQKTIKQYSALQGSLLQKLTVRALLALPFKISRFLTKFTVYKHEAKLIESSDEILSAPGGVNIGPYKDWTYLWRLYYALNVGKKTAIYSISFGPLPSNKLFKKRSTWVLKNVNFLSLRDKKSQTFAVDLGLNHIPSIDTTFLDQNDYKSLTKALNLPDKYIVITPNELDRWHHQYKNFSHEKIKDVYINIINSFIEMQINVVILPHLFGYNYDDLYIETIVNSLNTSDKITFFPSNNLNSNIVQAIISKANFAIGSRFHTIMFAIRNETPFFALSYEHKIMNTLTGLQLESCAIDFYKELDTNNEAFIYTSLFKTYKQSTKYFEIIKSKKDEAEKLALTTFDALMKEI